MHPVLIWKPWATSEPLIHTFGVMVLLGVLLGLFYVRRDAARVGMDGEEAMSLGVEVFLVGLVGSRIMFVMHNWTPLYADAGWFAPFDLRSGGLIWYGGMLSGAPYAVWRARQYKLNILRLCDLLAPPTILGLGIGRIGCMMAGDDHGRIWDEATWFTLTFQPDASNPYGHALLDEAYKGKPLLPSQPLMFFGCLAIFTILTAVRRKLAGWPGAVTAGLFIIYPVHRYLIELTRGDKIRGTFDDWAPFLKDTWLGNLSTSQGISVLLVVGGVILFVYYLKQPPVAAPEPLSPETPDGFEESEAKRAKRDKALFAGSFILCAALIPYLFPGHAHVGVFCLVVTFGVWGWALWDTHETAWVPAFLAEQREGEGGGAADAAST